MSSDTVAAGNRYPSEAEVSILSSSRHVVGRMETAPMRGRVFCVSILSSSRHVVGQQFVQTMLNAHKRFQSSRRRGMSSDNVLLQQAARGTKSFNPLVVEACRRTKVAWRTFNPFVKFQSSRRRGMSSDAGQETLIYLWKHCFNPLVVEACRRTVMWIR